jgi:hypothetical protein
MVILPVKAVHAPWTFLIVILTSPGRSCRDILNKGLSRGDGKYLINPDGSGKAIKVHCDMSSFGGGWTMCYTTDRHVNIKTELVTKPSTGYRADCNNIPVSMLLLLYFFLKNNLFDLFGL